MGYPAVTSFLDARRVPPSGIVLTAVLKGGCPLKCPFCIVNKRDERREQSYVTAEHLTELAAAIDRRGLLGGVAIVGDEPLQSHCWPDAKSLLSAAIYRRLPTALITNGLNLLDFTEELRALGNTKVVISLDAASEKHDKLRGVAGAFARIRAGIARAAEDEAFRERLSLATIMMPSNMAEIGEMVGFAAEYRIPQLVLSPLLVSARTEPLAVHPKVLKEAWRIIPRLADAAGAAGVKLRLSDEFAILGPWEERLAQTGIEVMTPTAPARLIRVDAAGRVETFATMRAGTTTGLQIPADPADIDGFADHLTTTHFAPLSRAA